MRRGSNTLAAVALALTTLLAPATFAGGFHYSALMDIDSFHHSDRTKTFTHEVKSAGATFTIALTLDGGSAEAQLLDGSGKVRWTHAFEAGKSKEEVHAGGQPGKWTVKLVLKGATGRYNLKLVAD